MASGPTALPPPHQPGKFAKAINDRGQALGMASETTATGKIKGFGQPGEVPGWVNYALLPVLNLVAAIRPLIRQYTLPFWTT